MKKADLKDFDGQKVGELDADMWQAYYNHRFFRLLQLLYLLVKEQLGLGRLVTLRCAGKGL